MSASEAMLAGPSLVLASTSPGRRALLERLRLPFEVVAPDVDEAGVLGMDGASTARLRAVAKAEDVARRRPEAHVIGSDQVLELDGELFGKPGSSERARAQLARLSGRVHQLITSVALLVPGEPPRVHTEVHHLAMRPLDEAAIGRYVDADAPEHCAGSYRIEGLGITLFERVEAMDWTGIVGLPLLAVSEMLRRAGWGLP